MAHFNPPPNWPPLGDFTPTAGWIPDPAWGAPPQGWALWVDDSGQPVPAPSAIPIAGGPRHAASTAPAVVLRFNPPPGWPLQPPGWTPPPGWQPDPSWGPAPFGWPLWVEEHKEGVGRPNAGWSIALVLVLAVIGLIVGYQPVSLLSGSGILYVGLALTAGAVIVAFAMKLRIGLRIVAVIALLLVGLNIGVVEHQLAQKRAVLRQDLAGLTGGSTSAPTSAAGASHSVIYKVTGNGTAANNITFFSGSGEQQISQVSLPWTFTLEAKAGSFAPLVVEAQANPNNSDSITCEIDVDGVVASTNTSSGAAAVVTCTAPIR